MDGKYVVANFVCLLNNDLKMWFSSRIFLQCEDLPLSHVPPLLCVFVLQVFMEFAKEQENEEDEVGSLSTTFQWQRLRQDGPVSVNHTDSIVHQLWTPTEREQAGDWPGLTDPDLPGFTAPEGSRQHSPAPRTPTRTALKWTGRTWVGARIHGGTDCVCSGSGLLRPLSLGLRCACV